VALVRAQSVLDKAEKGLSGDELVGARIVRKSLETPLRLIMANSGLEGSVVLEEVRKNKGDYGMDAEIGEYGSLIDKGIMDPVKVTRAALQNAASVATMVLTTESMITEIPEKHPAAPMPGGPPMDY
jgi:chaperonin GroEL